MEVANPCESYLFGQLMLVGFLPIIPMIILAYLLLGRYFDPRIHHRESLDFWMGTIGTFIGRPIGYAFFIVCNIDWKKLEKRATRRNPDSDPMGPTIRTYGGINYREEANAFQIGFSFLYIAILSLNVVLSFTALICKYLL